jgi:hypothetical protein
MGNQTAAKLSKYYINYHHINHNVETCRSKKEEPTIVATKITTHVGKPLRPLNHILSHLWNSQSQIDKLLEIW